MIDETTEPTKERLRSKRKKPYGPPPPPPDWHEKRRERMYEAIRNQTALDEARKSDALPPRQLDLDEITPERKRRARQIDENGKAVDGWEKFTSDTGRESKRMLDNSNLDLLYSRGSISGALYASGKQLYADWDASDRGKVAAIDPEKIRVDGGKMGSAMDYQIDAGERVDLALAAVKEVHAEALTAMVFHEQPLDVFGREHSHYTNKLSCTISAITTLKNALTELDKYYYRNSDQGRSLVRGGYVVPDRSRNIAGKA